MADFIIIDWEHTGHRIDYLDEINKYLKKNNKKAILLFPKINNKYLKNFKNLKKIFFKSKFKYSNSVFDKIFLKINLIKQITNYRKKNTKIIFLHLDSSIISLIFFLTLNPFKKFKISGILMRPEIHYLKYFNMNLSIKKKIKLYLKHISTKILYCFGVKIFTLDYKYSQYTNNQIKYLQDFVPIENINFNFPKYTPKNWINSKNRILAFGYIDERKGILELLECYKKEKLENESFLIVGSIETKIYKKILTYKKKIKNLNIINRYIDKKHLSGLIYNSHKIYAAYKNFPGSSGVLHWAKLLNKKIIVYNYGLMGYEAKKYKNSLILNNFNCKKMIKLIKTKNKKILKKKTIKLFNRPKTNFAEKLLNY